MREEVARQDVGERMHAFARQLFPICRSITGNGVRETLRLIGQRLPALQVREVPSGQKCFDWEVPLEWNIEDAFILDEHGERIVDFKRHNLHVVGYSVPVDKELSLDELQPHLHSLPELPSAIPYLTSYYRPTWGFCLAHDQRVKLRPGRYRVKIDSSLKAGSLSYGELILPGLTQEEILLSTYICHPSMGNNELSGPVVTTQLAEDLMALRPRRYTYRIVFLPETIGPIVYLSQNLLEMKRNVRAGFVISCVGDDKGYSFIPSRLGGTIADRVAMHVLKHRAPEFKSFSFLDRGSDERQYCSPGVDLPVVSILRTRYLDYPEYHTSLDDLDLISPSGLAGAHDKLSRCLKTLEENKTYKVTCLGEPQLGKRGLYPALSTKDSTRQTQDMLNLIAYSDGQHDLLMIADKIGLYFEDLLPVVQRLLEARVLLPVGQSQ
jgi:aminopeptidase-like protein